MNQEDYDLLCMKEGATSLGHPEFDESFHKKEWNDVPVTILICQRQTKAFTQLCIESLLRFYPDIKILIVDGESQDDSTLYLKYKELTNPNIKVWVRTGKSHSHGDTMNEAILQFVNTEYVLTMDSDTITNRGGWIEDMVDQLRTIPNLYATGTLMLVTRENFAIGSPKDESDVLRYAHPSCSMYHVPTYKTLKPFFDHGAPCVYNMMDAQEKGCKVIGYPIDKYVSHRMGVSWVKEHQIIWKDDYNVFIRPFVTFIISNHDQSTSLQNQTDRDFNMVPLDSYKQIRVWVDNAIDVNNRVYGIRNIVNGEYVCEIPSYIQGLPPNFVNMIKVSVIEHSAPKELDVNGIRVVERRFWQSKDALS